MKVGTDGVILGSWADVNEAEYVLDTGTGTGFIALMIAQRSSAHVDAVEIDESACKDAAINVEQSKWKNRIRVIHTSFQNFSAETDKKYDLIVSNPPYFTNSLKSGDSGKNLARHDDALPPGQLLNGVQKLLRDTGKFCLILPAASVSGFLTEAALTKLYCNKRVNIFPSTQKSSNRALLELSFTRTKTEDDKLIILGENGEYTSQYRELTKDFYLNF